MFMLAQRSPTKKAQVVAHLLSRHGEYIVGVVWDKRWLTAVRGLDEPKDSVAECSVGIRRASQRSFPEHAETGRSARRVASVAEIR